MNAGVVTTIVTIFFSSASLTLHQFCDRLKTAMFSRSYAWALLSYDFVIGRANINWYCNWFLQYLKLWKLWKQPI